jgi:hypothetical protein
VGDKIVSVRGNAREFKIISVKTKNDFLKEYKLRSKSVFDLKTIDKLLNLIEKANTSPKLKFKLHLNISPGAKTSRMFSPFSFFDKEQTQKAVSKYEEEIGEKVSAFDFKSSIFNINRIINGLGDSFIDIRKTVFDSAIKNDPHFRKRFENRFEEIQPQLKVLMNTGIYFKQALWKNGTYLQDPVIKTSSLKGWFAYRYKILEDEVDRLLKIEIDKIYEQGKRVRKWKEKELKNNIAEEVEKTVDSKLLFSQDDLELLKEEAIKLCGNFIHSSIFTFESLLMLQLTEQLILRNYHVLGHKFDCVYSTAPKEEVQEILDRLTKETLFDYLNKHNLNKLKNRYDVRKKRHEEFLKNKDKILLPKKTSVLYSREFLKFRKNRELAEVI